MSKSSSSSVLARIVVAAALLAIGLTGWMFARSAAVADDPQRRQLRIAITFDDLPGSLELPRGYDSERLIVELVGALRAHRVKHATGFVIGERLSSDPRGKAALAHWSDSGYEFGNHSYSHKSFAELGSGYFADATRWEPTMRALERSARQPLRFFRYPYLQEGRDAVERAQLASGLSRLGYTLARVSLDFRDWEWADAYNRCIDQQDAAGEAALSRSYLDYAHTSLGWTLAATEEQLHRPLTHVLLLHANLATARNLDALLTYYEQQGAEFVSLAEALADPAFTAVYPGHEGTLLTLLSEQQGQPLPRQRPRPELARTCP